MTKRDLPIACDLSRMTDDQRRREQELLGKFRTQLVQEVETEDGIWYSFAAQPEALAALGEFLGLERLCCPFLTFRLEVSREETSRLCVSGPPGTKQFLRKEFGG